MKYVAGLLLMMYICFSCEEEYGSEYENLLSERAGLGCWTHSYEEQDGDPEVLIYRPCTFREFPPAHYRHEMVLEADGKCSWLNLAPNDAHTMVAGLWTFNSKTKVIEIYTLSGSLVDQMMVVATGHDLLKLKRIN